MHSIELCKVRQMSPRTSMPTLPKYAAMGSREALATHAGTCPAASASVAAVFAMPTVVVACPTSGPGFLTSLCYCAGRVSVVEGMPGALPAARIFASVCSIAAATGGALGLPG